MGTVKRVAILAPSGGGSYGQVINSLMNQNRKRFSDKIRLYPVFTGGVKTEQVLQCLNSLFQSECDLLVTIGSKASHLANQEIKARKLLLPQICVGIGMHDIPAPSKTSDVVSICYDSGKRSRIVDFLSECSTKTTRLLVLCEDARIPCPIKKKTFCWLDSQLADFRKSATDCSITMDVVSRWSTSDLQVYVRNNIQHYNSFLLVEGSFGMHLYKMVTNLAMQHKKPVAVGLLEAVQFGAAVGYGQDFSPLGEKAYEYIKAMLIDNVPITSLDHYDMPDCRKAAVNLATAERQGLDPQHLQKVCEEWGGIIYTEAAIDTINNR